MNWEFLIFIAWGIIAAMLVIPTVLQKELFKDFTIWFNEGGRIFARAQRYFLHVKIGYVLGAVTVLIFYWFAFSQFADMRWYELLTLFVFLGTFGTAVLWEYPRTRAGGQYTNKEWKVPFSWRDCRMSGYGYALGGVSMLLFLNLVT